MRIRTLLIVSIALTCLTGCLSSGFDFVPAVPADAVGEWQGTYSNSVDDSGVIRVTFFMVGSTLRATYDLENGGITGTSDVLLDGRTFSFTGGATRLKEFSAYLSLRAEGLDGTIVVDYPTWGTRSGPVTLSKVY